MTSLIATLRWAVLVALILVIAGNGTLLLREISAMKAAQRMKNRLLILVIATCVILSVFFIGVAVWAQPQVSALSVIADGSANRYSELGAAMAGGAIIAGTVLVAERLFAHDAEDRATRFQQALQKDALRFQVGLEKDVSGIDLRGEDLRRSYWYEKNVSYAYLVKVRFEDSYLKGCNFESTYLLGANFAGAHLGGVNFTSARLGGADFRGADLTGAKLFGAIIKSDRDPLKPHEGFTGGVDFAEADLYRTNVKGANLTAVVGIEEAVNLDKLVWDDLTIWPGGGPPAGLGPPTPG